MKLTHLGISHFRSIGETPVMIDLSKKITVLVGQNDCGKSNVLRGIQCVCELERKAAHPLPEIDWHKRSQIQPTLTYVKGNISQDADEECLPSALDEKYANGLSFKDWKELLAPDRFSALRGPRDADLILSSLPRFIIMPQFRRIEEAEEYSIVGKGVIKLLSQWQHPEIGEDAKRRNFDRVEKLLRDVLGSLSLSLEIPHNHREIIVRDGDLRLPLDSHGTGIHQLIILAIAVLSQDNVIFGIEEPEIHLHPVLQRRFLKFLREETGDNRYIITTHSQTMIAPAEDVDVIHLKMVDGVTIPTRVTTDAQALEALDDLGVRASDLLQANAVIWVEGPSDRLYLKRWMELVNRELGEPELIEGIDYAMMFYGGRLLSHLSLEREDDIDDGFIQLLRINQRSAIVMDSDRETQAESLNATKLRVIAECEANGLLAWVTDGREIENYLTQRTVEAAVTAESLPLDDRFKPRSHGDFGKAMERVTGVNAPAKCKYDKNKVPWAHRFVKHVELEDMSVHLKEQVKALIHFIRRPSGAA